MKAIMIDRKIISLENVLEVCFDTFGTGAKSNPYYWSINITYTNKNKVHCGEFDNEKTAEKWFNEIFEKLTKTA